MRTRAELHTRLLLSRLNDRTALYRRQCNVEPRDFSANIPSKADMLLAHSTGRRRRKQRVNVAKRSFLRLDSRKSLERARFMDSFRGCMIDGAVFCRRFAERTSSPESALSIATTAKKMKSRPLHGSGRPQSAVKCAILRVTQIYGREGRIERCPLFLGRPS